MPGRKGLSTVLMMSLLACGVARGQQAVPWGPQLPPMPSVRVGGAQPVPGAAVAPTQGGSTNQAPAGPTWPVSLAAGAMPAQPTPVPESEVPPSPSDAEADLWQSDDFSIDPPLPREGRGVDAAELEATSPPAPMVVPSQTPLPLGPGSLPPAAQPEAAAADSSPIAGITPLLQGSIWNQQPTVDPAARFLAENQPQVVERLYEQVLDLEPNRDNRQAIERVREAVLMTQVGEDTSAEEWNEIDDPGIRWGGRIHLDWINWANDQDFDVSDGQRDYVEFRRLRLFAAGRGYGVLYYQLEMEFSPELDAQAEIQGNQVNLGALGLEMKDAFLGMRDLPWLGNVRIGHFFTPIGLEAQTSSNFSTFLERSLPRVFLPGRELGVASFNYTADERLTWSYGAFFYEMDEALHGIENDNQGTRLIGRVTGTPWYDELSEGRYLVHLGLGYGYARPRRRTNPDPLNALDEYRPVEFSARPEIHGSDALIETGEINTQEYQTLDGEFAWVRGPLSLQSELLWTGLDELHGGNTDLYSTYVFASYFLTGESRPYDRRQGVFDRPVPYENFWMVGTPRGTSAGWGAWELTTRWSYVDMSDVREQQLHDLTLGCNWYWNPFTRMMFNYIHPFAHNSPLSTPTNAEGDILALRMQVDF